MEKGERSKRPSNPRENRFFLSEESGRAGGGLPGQTRKRRSRRRPPFPGCRRPRGVRPGPSPPTAPTPWAPAREPAGVSTGTRHPGVTRKPSSLLCADGNPPAGRPGRSPVRSSSICGTCLGARQVAAGLRRPLPASLKARSPSPGRPSTREPCPRISPSPAPSAAGEGGRGRQEEAAGRPECPGPEGRCLGMKGGRSSVGLPRGHGALSPSGRGQGIAGLLGVSPPASPSHLPRCPAPLTPSVLPYRPVSRAVGDGIRHASHGQASPPQLGDLLLHEEIVGIPATLAVRHGKRGRASSCA